MIIKNSLKQMFRTPLKTFLFFCLLAVSAALFVLGLNISWLNQRDASAFEGLFNTVGTVEQKPTETEIDGEWDAEIDQYYYYSREKYGALVSEDVLDFEGVDYIHAPMNRPYFTAYMPDMILRPGEVTERVNDWLVLVEVTPLRTDVMDSLPCTVTRVLAGDPDLLNRKIWVCEHYNPTPETVMETGKTYIMRLNQGTYPHDDRDETYMGENDEWEYTPISQYASQYNRKGERINSDTPDRLIDEVTEGFYESDEAKPWLELMKESNMMNSLLPVQPVDATKLLMAFHENNAAVQDGRDISQEEYAQGKRVCLVPEDLAMSNNLQVGDRLTLPLIAADYGSAPGFAFKYDGGGGGYNLRNGKGEVLSVFDENAYEIVGIYSMAEKDDSDFGLGYNEIIIPYASVTSSWDNNIVSFGRMNKGTTSFQIPNGGIEHYLKLWEKQGIDNLEIKFYDNGYSVLEENINNRRVMSVLFLAGGVIMAILVLALFCHLFISRASMRTAIERSLGMKKKQCILSLLSGLMSIVLLGTAAGAVVGCVLTDKTAEQLKQEQIYDETFTSGGIGDGKEGEEALASQQQITPSELAGTAVAGGILILLLGGGIAMVYIRQNLKKEPIMMLMGNEE
ncbi:MAG: FtsX-like permease family protein [Lachnospiraceae bacterium]|nr:FtsX-like permease family protein [Lachnospiraceae bacterium]